jgi:hypothetical protein
MPEVDAEDLAGCLSQELIPFVSGKSQGNPMFNPVRGKKSTCKKDNVANMNNLIPQVNCPIIYNSGQDRAEPDHMSSGSIL